MTDLREQCVSEEPTSGKRCTLPANHDVHRNVGTAWSTDHEAWRAALDAKDTEIAEANRLVGTYMAAAQVAEHERKRAEQAEARLAELENALAWQTTCVSCARLLDASVADHQHAEQAEAERDRLKATVEYFIDQENEHGPSCEYGKPCPYITDLEAALDQPGDQPKGT